MKNSFSTPVKLSTPSKAKFAPPANTAPFPRPLGIAETRRRKALIDYAATISHENKTEGRMLRQGRVNPHE